MGFCYIQGEKKWTRCEKHKVNSSKMKYVDLYYFISYDIKYSIWFSNRIVFVIL